MVDEHTSTDVLEKIVKEPKRTVFIDEITDIEENTNRLNRKNLNKNVNISNRQLNITELNEDERIDMRTNIDKKSNKVILKNNNFKEPINKKFQLQVIDINSKYLQNVDRSKDIVEQENLTVTNEIYDLKTGKLQVTEEIKIQKAEDYIDSKSTKPTKVR